MSTQNDRDRDRTSNAAGQRQQQRRQAAGPWGDARAVIDVTVRGDTKTRFVQVGTVWETDSGNLKLVLEAMPNEWSDPHVRRVVVLMKRDSKAGGQ